MSKIKELIDELNEYCEDNLIYDVDDIDDDRLTYVDSVGTDEHRWYILEELVYKVLLGDDCYYIGCWAVKSLKSESMSVSDCGRVINFHEMEKYETVSYRRKKEEQVNDNEL